MKRKQIRKFKWHIRKFKSAMIKFNATHEGRFLTDAIENIFEISTDIEDVLRHQQVFSYVKISGWAEPKALKFLTNKKLQRLNAGQFVAITKHIPRNDVKEILGEKYLKTGFEIIFQSKYLLAPKLFSSNSGIWATGSNSDVQMILHGLEGNDLVSLTDFQSKFLVSVDECSRRYHSLFPVKTPKDLYLLARFHRFLEESSNEIIQAFRYSDLSSCAAFFANLATGDLKSKLNYLAGLASVNDNSAEWKSLKIVRVYAKTNDAPKSIKMQPGIPMFEDLGRGLQKAVSSGLETKNSPLVLKDVININITNGGTIYDSDNLYVTDAAADPRHEFVSGQVTHIFGAPIIGSTAVIKKVNLESSDFSEGILLSGRNDDNYYHWMIESLPRALALDAMCDEALPFIISSRVPQSGKQALSMVSKRQVIELDASKQSTFKRLTLSTSAASILDTKIADWSEIIRLDASALLKFREFLLSPADHPKFEDKVFLKRTSSRRGLMNQSEIIRVAEQMGYSIYDPSELNFADQLNLFRFAKNIVGATGAVMANFIFTSTDAKILGLASSDNATSVLPGLMTSIAGSSYFSLEGKDSTRSDTHTGNLHNNFTINVKQFQNALSVMNLT